MTDNTVYIEFEPSSGNVGESNFIRDFVGDAAYLSVIEKDDAGREVEYNLVTKLHHCFRFEILTENLREAFEVARAEDKARFAGVLKGLEAEIYEISKSGSIVSFERTTTKGCLSADQLVAYLEGEDVTVEREELDRQPTSFAGAMSVFNIVIPLSVIAFTLYMHGCKKLPAADAKDGIEESQSSAMQRKDHTRFLGKNATSGHVAAQAERAEQVPTQVSF